MIFAHTLDQVIQGQKWQTRRLVKASDCLVEGVAIQRGTNRILYAVGKTYAVQPNRGKKAVARILLTGLRRERVADITESDARAEGFLSREEFLSTWCAIHGIKSDLNREVWVFEFKLDSVMDEQLKVIYGNRVSKNGCTYHSNDLSLAVAGLSGIGMHSWNYKVG